jgi:glycosyltransferase involved in cell wall biosynthesis
MTARRLAITWPLTDGAGWGVFGLNLVIQMLERGGPRPLLLAPPNIGVPTPELAAALAPLAGEQAALMAQIRAAGRHATLNGVTVLHGLGNLFMPGDVSWLVGGEKNAGFIFFEDTGFDADALDRARWFDRILVGSSWNRDVLTGLGLDDVVCVLQGIDERLFHPGPRAGLFGERFVVFSGGKLEYRKAQDIVLAAFRVFHRRHPDALLVAAWHNPWPESAHSLATSPHGTAAPEIGADGNLRIAEWIAAQGIPADAVRIIGWLSNLQMPALLREAHVGLFPNRCEGGTNLVAMETMACGVPCILSANTGHLDLIDDERCYPLRQQPPCACGNDRTGAWGESSVDEIVETLERVYAGRDEAARRGLLGAAFMETLTWRSQIAKLLTVLSDLL